VYEKATCTLTLRNYNEIERFFDGFEILNLGVVQLPMWRPDGRLPGDVNKILDYGGVGRKPAAIGERSGPVPADSGAVR
jgi:hypothetical protein